MHKIGENISGCEGLECKELGTIERHNSEKQAGWQMMER